ncbi:MAG: hypothetical protein M0P73_16755 [Syntrophobacterales bacterium]|jgi:hypothetical protein|nr:hypothetical protein [Syntrophobacterales bacterium]
MRSDPGRVAWRLLCPWLSIRWGKDFALVAGDKPEFSDRQVLYRGRVENFSEALGK